MVIVSTSMLLFACIPDNDLGNIAGKALAKMVVERAKDYPEPKPEYMRISETFGLMNIS